MIPKSERAKWKEDHKSREIDLDMWGIREHLCNGRREPASERANKYIRPKPQVDDPTISKLPEVEFNVLSLSLDP
jgi:hypothetical protein